MNATINMQDWPFKDPPNTAVFVDDAILKGNKWIYYVGHDIDDGAWQFHGPDGLATENELRVVGLKTIATLDESILSLSDLPLGWCAWRRTKESEWERAPQSED